MIQKITQDLDALEPPLPGASGSSPVLTPDPARPVSESVEDATPASWPSNIDTVPSSNTGDSAPEISKDLDLPPRDTSERNLFGNSFRETLNVNLHGEEDLRFLMAYKDYLFPLLHPFYHPSFFEGGHNWLLVAAFRNQESRQLIVSLVTYFFSVVPFVPGAGYTLCSTFTWDQVQKQSEQAFKGMQHRVEMLDVTANLWGKSHLFGDIMLLLEFEAMTQYSQAWRPHLEAAIILFEQILSSPEIGQIVWRITFDPAEMTAEEANKLNSSGIHLFSSTQVALRFFATKIIIADIVSSSALEQTPRLRGYHESLMASRGEASLNLKDVTGCENWVFLGIAEIVALGAWKKKTKTDGTFSFMSLVQRAGKIIEKLDHDLIELNRYEDIAQETSRQQDEIFGELTLLRNMRPPHTAYRDITRIWATAARLYLIVVVSGWQPGTSEVIELVSSNLKLLETLTTPSWLMNLAWPFCVTGCLASESQQTVAENIFNRTKPINNVGGLAGAMKVVRETWKRRGALDQDWDMAACFKSLDSVPLLV
ncbi:transcriptional regulatory UME6 [Fusarium beomiforme]|uniref:Transcriptional regulatory UME6 n=1 Tax=Fusarium beomiforme TaxID=44412 RepID=A0A9P5E4K6_9HYPO|nr:transcriptional regulatory UME6 [Fusarium beomiforme]